MLLLQEFILDKVFCVDDSQSTVDIWTHMLVNGDWHRPVLEVRRISIYRTGQQWFPICLAGWTCVLISSFSGDTVYSVYENIVLSLSGRSLVPLSRQTALVHSLRRWSDSSEGPRDRPCCRFPFFDSLDRFCQILHRCQTFGTTLMCTQFS